MNEFNQRCHLVLKVAQAVAKHRCIAYGRDRPVLEPLAIASSYSKCPSCDQALQQELRNPLSRHTLTHSLPQCVILTARGIRVLQVFVWWKDCSEKTSAMVYAYSQAYFSGLLFGHGRSAAALLMRSRRQLNATARVPVRAVCL